MGTRSVTTVVTADTMALNAAIFGFAGHSLVTPQHAIQSVWWTDERIDGKVTREFVVSKLRPSERDQLYRPIFTGSGLTEDTYLDWILRKGKRIFLVLVECGVSDQIFGIMEDAWDDNDLPIPRDEVQCLALSYKADESLNKKFYDNQFRFLLRPLDMEVHIDYAPNEVIPIEFVHRLAPSAALQKWSRLHLPKRPNQIYVRRKIFLGEKDEVDEELKWKLLQDVNNARSVDHSHIASIIASWSQKGVGYFMTPFVGEHTLKSFIDFRTPASMQKVKKNERYTIVLEWMHCLAHALTTLHRRQLHHGAISPSNILIDESNCIAFSDIGCLESFQKDKKMEPDEGYNYGAPEFFTESRQASPTVLSLPTPPSRKFFGHRRQKSSQSNSSEETAAALSVDLRGNYYFKPRSCSVETITPQTTESSEILSPPPQYSANDLFKSISLNLPSERDRKFPIRAPPPPPLVKPPSREGPDKKAGDVFSMACIYLDMISFMLKRKPLEFSKHRSTKHKNSTGKGSHIDASFHNNMQKVQSWMEVLENDLPTTQDQALLALPPIFRLIGEMLNSEAHRRPSVAEVQDRVYDALISYGGLNITHCTNTVRSPSIASVSSSPTTTALSSSGGSRPSISSVQKIAAFPPLLSPTAPPKSPLRPLTSSSTASTLIPGKLDTPAPPLPPKSSSRYDNKYSPNGWGKSNPYLSAKGSVSGIVGVSV